MGDIGAFPEFFSDEDQPSKEEGCLQAIRRDLSDSPVDIRDLERSMQTLMENRYEDLPLPGRGATAARWKALAAVASIDLSLAKIFESHTDARAILDELGETAEAGALLAVWAAEDPRHPLIFDPTTSRLTGEKPWCSGAAIVDEGLLTARSPEGRNLLVRVAMGQETAIMVKPSAWASAGIAAAETATVTFDRAFARPVGRENAYLDRPGFWQGGAGIAAVWYGGALPIAARLAASLRGRSDPHGAAHLGAVYSSLQSARALLLATAAWIDAQPQANAMVPARALRAAVEMAATETIQRTGRALGARPLCTDAAHAKRVADLEVFLRQSHAEKDLAALGGALGETEIPWLW